MSELRTFFGYAITFRHEHIRHDRENGLYNALNCDHMYFFANQMYRDKKFPKECYSYSILKHYVTENYTEDCVHGFELIWQIYSKSKMRIIDQEQIDALEYSEKYQKIS